MNVHFVKPGLEILEDRLTPSYLWSPTNGVDFNTAANWKDSITGQRETNAPGPMTDCRFDGTSDGNVEVVNETANCRSLYTTGWNGILTIDGGTLNVVGEELAPWRFFGLYYSGM